MFKVTRTLRERFEEKYIPEPMSGCWLWLASLMNTGYGQIMETTNRPILAHRASYGLYVGEVPPGMHVLHRCDNKACVNPDHLFLGDNQANRDDMSRKGRGRRSALGLPYGVRQRDGRFRAVITVHYRHIHFGTFATAEEASAAAVAGRKEVGA